jgi:hypothetical protein
VVRDEVRDEVRGRSRDYAQKDEVVIERVEQRAAEFVFL